LDEEALAITVLVVGAGGLGSTACLYMAAAGVHTLGVVDHDIIEMSNLHRQIIYSAKWVGQSKAKMAARRCKELNPKINVKAYPHALDEKNAFNLAQEYDILLDCTDNTKSRYLIGRAASKFRKPVVMGAAQRMDGQVALLGHGGPCYRCMYPNPKSRVEARCSDTGVLGVIPGIVGCLQALMALNWIISEEAAPEQKDVNNNDNNNNNK